MKDPSTARFQYFTNVVNSGQMIGENRPVGRVTVSKNIINSFPTPRGTWRSYRKRVDLPLLDPRANWPEKELPNVMSITINRVLGQAAASCEITIANMSQTLPEVSDFGVGNPGYMTPDRGSTPKDYTVEFSTRKNEWFDLLRPNRIIHTYQGYGSDDTTQQDPSNPLYVSPANDSRIQRTGVWVIDSIVMNSPMATMTLVCRDVAKFLIEQFTFPPVVDVGRWPLYYQPAIDAPSGTTTKQATAASPSVMNVAKWHSSSNNGSPGVNTPMFGHYPTDSVDGNLGSAWLSAGHSASRATDSYEYIQFDTGGNTLNYLQLRTWKGGYIVYISFDQLGNGVWGGSLTIPSTASNGTNIKYQLQRTVAQENVTDIYFDTPIKAKYVRLTFTALSDFGALDSNASTKFRVGIRDVVLGNKSTTQNSTSPPVSNVGQPGVIRDYSEIVREALAWGGFFEPATSPPDPVVSYLDATNVSRGGLWADIEILNSAPITPLPVEEFTSVALMDVIQKVSDIHGAIFFVDDEGAAIFRLPNVWQIGNYIVDPLSSDPRARLSRHPIVLDESVNMISISTTMDDSSLRSDFLVTGIGTGSDGKVPTGGFTPGFNAADPADSANIDDKSLLGGQVRVAAISGTPVTTDLEAQRMAELLALQAHFAYRRSSIVAPCHPCLQLDDQIKVRDRITNDSYIHYVNGISTHMDLETGEYTMTVSTNWLGDDPTNTWVFNSQEVSSVAKYYTSALANWQTIQSKQAGG